MRYFTYILIAIVNFILQSTLFEHIAIIGIKPNTMIILVVSISLMRGELEGAFMGMITGLLQDCYFSTYIGFYVFLGMALGYICGLVCKGFYRENYIVPIIVVAISTFLYEFLYFVFNILLQGYTDFMIFFRNIILPEIVYNAMITFILYILLLKINYLLEDKERHRRYKKKNIMLK